MVQAYLVDHSHLAQDGALVHQEDHLKLDLVYLADLPSLVQVHCAVPVYLRTLPILVQVQDVVLVYLVDLPSLVQVQDAVPVHLADLPTLVQVQDAVPAYLVDHPTLVQVQDVVQVYLVDHFILVQVQDVVPVYLVDHPNLVQVQDAVPVYLADLPTLVQVQDAVPACLEDHLKAGTGSAQNHHQVVGDQVTTLIKNKVNGALEVLETFHNLKILGGLQETPNNHSDITTLAINKPLILDVGLGVLNHVGIPTTGIPLLELVLTTIH